MSSYHAVLKEQTFKRVHELILKFSLELIALGIRLQEKVELLVDNLWTGFLLKPGHFFQCLSEI